MKSVGIHVDSRKIRILELEISAKRLSLLNLFEMERSSDDSISEILRSYFQTSGRPDRVVASVGNVPVVVKNFSLPFRDRSRVSQAISAEFEDSLPIVMDDYILEFQPVGRANNLNTFIGALVSREPMEEMNRVFENIDVLPSDFLIPSEAVARMGLSLLAKEFAPGSVVCFCDIGFDSTQISVVKFPREGKSLKPTAYADAVLEFRHISRGSKDIYDREASRMAMSTREFEDWLTANASFEQGVPQIDNIKNAVRPLLVELYQVTQAAMSKTGHKVENFVISGPLSHTPGFRDFFETELRTPAVVWDPFQSLTASRTPTSPEASARFVIPLALALRHGVFKSLPWLNFKRSSKSKQIISAAIEELSAPEIKSVIIPAAIMAVALFILSMGASVLMDARVQKAADRAKIALSRAKAPVGSDVERLLTETDEVTEEFETYRAKQMAKLPSNNVSTAMIDDLLKISQSLPLNVKVSELKITAGKGVKDIQASLDTSKVPTFSKEELQKALSAKGYKSVSVDGQNLKAKGR